MNRLAYILALAALAAGLAVQAVAQTSAAKEAFKGSGELRNRIAKTVSAIDDYLHQLNAVDRSLDRVPHADTDLRSHYRVFSEDVQRLHRAQAHAARELEKTTLSGAGYFDKWEEANLEIADPALRQRSRQSRSRTMGRLAQITRQVAEVASELAPMNNRLDDLNTLLGAQMTTDSIGSAIDVIAICREEIRSLKNRTAELREKLKQFLTEVPK